MPASVFFDDDLANPFTDRLFDSLNLPYEFPDPKEMAQAGKADFIQPSLLQLQPSLEEIMQSLASGMDGKLANYHQLMAESSRTDYSGVNGRPSIVSVGGIQETPDSTGMDCSGMYSKMTTS